MRIGLIDVDGHHFPNLALMRISAYHKSLGDIVEWWETDLIHYDIVYKSKIFSDAYSKDVPDPINCDNVVGGGTGYAISLVNGVEVYDKSKDKELPEEIERMFPDYSIYPEFDFAVSLTSRGCPRGCHFCHVAPKEGRCSHKVADVKDFWCGQEKIEVLDPNILACKDRLDLLQQYADTKALINYNQGLDIRLFNDDVIKIINQTRIDKLHFAWDNPQDDLLPYFEYFKDNYRRKSNGTTVYVLTNYNSTHEEDMYRIYKLWEMKYYPYVMVYNKPSAPLETRRVQRWCNNRFFFKSCKFEDMVWKPNTTTSLTKKELEMIKNGNT